MFEVEYISLFISAFLSATILPFSSEVVFSGMLLSGYEPFYCLLAASLGNGLGGSLTFWLGQTGRKLIKNNKRIERYSLYVQQYGAWMGWLSWLPVLGDPIVLLMGFFKTPRLLSHVFIWCGKIARYILLYALLA